VLRASCLLPAWPLLIKRRLESCRHFEIFTTIKKKKEEKKNHRNDQYITECHRRFRYANEKHTHQPRAITLHNSAISVHV